MITEYLEGTLPADGPRPLRGATWPDATPASHLGQMRETIAPSAICRPSPCRRRRSARSVDAFRRLARGLAADDLGGARTVAPPPPGVSIRSRSPGRSSPSAFEGRGSPFSRLRPGCAVGAAVAAPRGRGGGAR